MITLGITSPAKTGDVEKRESTDLALLAALSGGSLSPLSSGETQVALHVGEAAGVWARRLSLGRIVPNGSPSALCASFLWRVGSALALRGEHVEVIRLSARGLQLIPTVWHAVEGVDFDPLSWEYHVDISSPDHQQEFRLRGDEVLHFRLPSSEPWRGRHVLEDASETRALLLAIERQLEQEASTPSKSIITLPTGVKQSTVDGMRSSIGIKDERVLLPETTQKHGRMDNPQVDWKPTRLKAAPASELIELRRDLREQVLSAYGVPPSSLSSNPSGQRDAERVLRQTIVSLGRARLARADPKA